MNSFGAMLKRNRKLAGLTQEQLAEKLDVSTVATGNRVKTKYVQKS